MTYIFLDDERNPSDVTWVNLPKGVDWIVVRDLNGFERVLLSLSTPPELITFDHDLGFGNGIPDLLAPTGMDCAHLLIEICLERNWPLPAFAVHSMNPVGAENIGRLLSNFKDFQSSN